ncbi:MAG: NisI/SpaI family lantibiotic immunity lipoprotein [Clostridia bacterium]|nr:NisI/SpaI family lantibiotic immunity lipoprotein [Clostridia bacterium]
MNKKVYLIMPILVLTMLLLCSCAFIRYPMNKEKCGLTVNDRITVSYNEHDYVIINERLDAEEIGAWIGVVNKNISGVMFASVYTDKKNADMINISINDAFFRAIATDKLLDEMSLFELDAYQAYQAGVQTVSIDESNALQLLFNGNTYAVTDRQIARSDLGAFVCSIARSLTCDADTGRIIPKDEALAVDWDGSLKQNRRLLNYGNVYWAKNTDDLAVGINGEFRIAAKQ